MRRLALAVLWAPLACAVLVSFAFADGLETHFGPGERLEPIDVAALGGAQRTIEMAAYILTDVPVIEALTAAALRGVKVRIFRQIEDHAPSARVASALDALERAGAQTQYKLPGSPLMHLKAYCVDGTLLRVGAANFSHSGLTEQDNDLEIERGPGVCGPFEADFEALWSGR